MNEELENSDEFIKLRNASICGFLVAIQNMKHLIDATSKSRTLGYLNDWYSNVEAAFKDDELWEAAKDCGILNILLGGNNEH